MLKLPYLSQQAGRAVPKGQTRLELAEAERRLTRIDEKQFRSAVWQRDGAHCRRCLRKVQKCLERVAGRGEVHHLHGRSGDLRFDVRAACLLCLACHERLTGKVNAHRVAIVASQTFTTRQGTFTDATHLIQFVEVPL